MPATMVKKVSYNGNPAPAYTTHEVHSNVQQIFRPKQETILSNTRYQVDFSKHPSLVFHPEPFPGPHGPLPGPPKPRPGPHGPLPRPPKPIPGPYGPLPGPLYNGIRVERNACQNLNAHAQNVNAGVRGHPDSVKCCTTSTLTRDFKNHNTGETSSTIFSIMHSTSFCVTPDFFGLLEHFLLSGTYFIRIAHCAETKKIA